MTETPAGGGGGSEIFSLLGSVGVDTTPVIAGLDAANSAARTAAQQQTQALAAISQAYARAATESRSRWW